MISWHNLTLSFILEVENLKRSPSCSAFTWHTSIFLVPKKWAIQLDTEKTLTKKCDLAMHRLYTTSLLVNMSTFISTTSSTQLIFYCTNNITLFVNNQKTLTHIRLSMVSKPRRHYSGPVPVGDCCSSLFRGLPAWQLRPHNSRSPRAANPHLRSSASGSWSTAGPWPTADRCVTDWREDCGSCGSGWPRNTAGSRAGWPATPDRGSCCSCSWSTPWWRRSGAAGSSSCWRGGCWSGSWAGLPGRDSRLRWSCPRGIWVRKRRSLRGGSRNSGAPAEKTCAMSFACGWCGSGMTSGRGVGLGPLMWCLEALKKDKLEMQIWDR